mmetsp:Transcript_23522/g.35584  ORF Transcript_23522/g.35584 Transcript_23522/m.35584 type:complete len:115 (+) Transcript_23522:81-425(+)
MSHCSFVVIASSLMPRVAAADMTTIIFSSLMPPAATKPLPQTITIYIYWLSAEMYPCIYFIGRAVLLIGGGSLPLRCQRFVDGKGWGGRQRLMVLNASHINDDIVAAGCRHHMA